MGQGKDGGGDEGVQYGMAAAVQGQAQGQRLDMGVGHLSQHILSSQLSCGTGLQDTQCRYMGENQSTLQHLVSLLQVLHRIHSLGKEKRESAT